MINWVMLNYIEEIINLNEKQHWSYNRTLRDTKATTFKIGIETIFNAMFNLFWRYDENQFFHFEKNDFLRKIFLMSYTLTQFRRKINSLKWERILYTNRWSIKNAIQRGVGQLSTTNHFYIIKVFLKLIVLFFRQNKYTNIRRFWTIFCAKTKGTKCYKSLQKVQNCTVLSTMAIHHIFNKS